jgi:alpha-soluble NSF attachment protein
MSQRGDQFFRDAEKKLESFSLFNKKGKYSDAADLFVKAGNSFKSIREWEKAGSAYGRAVDCWLQLNSLNDAAQCAADSGKMYAKTPETAKEAIAAFRQAVQIYRENSKPTNAAKLLVEAAKLFQEGGDLDSAIEALTDAAQLYDDENQPLQAVTQLSAVADLKSMQKKWLDGAKAYKEVGLRRCKDRLTQMAAGEPFTRSVLCQMAGEDSVGAEQLLAEFATAYPGWERSREYAMLVACLKAWDEKNPEAFSTAVAEYDGIKRLDAWQTEVLLAVKRLIEGDEEDLS